MSVSLAQLPPELYSAILAQVPIDVHQQTVLALSRAIPSRVPIYHLFEHVRLTHGDQIVKFYLRLRGGAKECLWVRTVSLEAWTVDADIVVNLVGVLARLYEVRLFIGPNFSPEHLEDMFQKPRPELRALALRFRPYVQKATYYQFLKGAYFDTTLAVISRWPAGDLPALSIVQDPLDPEIAKSQHFAQPLVFFRLDPLAALVCAPSLHNLTSLRLRIPSRQVARFIYSSPGALPALQSLDLSTCNILESDVDALLMRYPKLLHLILDGCNILRGEIHEGEWATLGKNCALSGVKRAKEREKKLKTWLQINMAQLAAPNSNPGDDAGSGGPAQQAVRRPRAGRRGLATATISLRDSPPKDTITLPSVPASKIPRIRIFPPSPTLRSLATTSVIASLDKHDAIRAEFERGWGEGLAQLISVRGRLRQSSKNGVRVMRFHGDDLSEEGFEGLVDEDDELTDKHQEEVSLGQTPVLCLAGPKCGATHAAGCGHKAGWDTWNDKL